jgi:hypothetical protein
LETIDPDLEDENDEILAVAATATAEAAEAEDERVLADDAEEVLRGDVMAGWLLGAQARD